MTEPAASNTADTGEWTEAKYNDALKHLDELQERVDLLRMTIPDMLAACSGPHAAPEELYRSFKTVAHGALKGVQDLRDAWAAEETQTVLKKTSTAPKKTSTAPGEPAAKDGAV